jgi:hypothetical protein
VLQTPVAANCVAQGIQPGGTQNPDFDCRGLLVNIDNHIIPLLYYGMRKAKFPERRGRNLPQRAARTGVETSGFFEVAVVLVCFDHVA